MGYCSLFCPAKVNILCGFSFVFYCSVTCLTGYIAVCNLATLRSFCGSGSHLRKLTQVPPFDNKLIWSLHFGVKHQDNSIEDFVHSYLLPWELETISDIHTAYDLCTAFVVPDLYLSESKQPRYWLVCRRTCYWTLILIKLVLI